MRTCRSALLVLSLVPVGRPARADELKPENTCGVLVGVLKWEHPVLSSFSDRHRKDRELYGLLVRRGVPAKNLALLLDNDATLANIRRSLVATAAKAGPGSTFLFYHAGHGGLRPGGGVEFYNYDYSPNPPKKPALQLAEVGALLKKHFKGGRVLLMADCCHSGGLE